VGGNGQVNGFFLNFAYQFYGFLAFRPCIINRHDTLSFLSAQPEMHDKYHMKVKVAVYVNDSPSQARQSKWCGNLTFRASAPITASNMQNHILKAKFEDEAALTVKAIEMWSINVCGTGNAKVNKYLTYCKIHRTANPMLHRGTSFARYRHLSHVIFRSLPTLRYSPNHILVRYLYIAGLTMDTAMKSRQLRPIS
jgi:hypothetical protein